MEKFSRGPYFNFNFKVGRENVSKHKLAVFANSERCPSRTHNKEKPYVIFAART